MSVMAEDYRLDFRPRKGTTVAEFCSEWATTCPTVVRHHNIHSSPHEVCEQAPKPGVAQAYCNGVFASKTTQYANEVAKDLHATPV
ncbi:hypothetical protein Unana1_03639 [Umbelopsis nana]